MTTQDPTSTSGRTGARPTAGAPACPPGTPYSGYSTAPSPPPPGAAAQATPRVPSPEQAQIPGEETPAGEGAKRTGNPAVDAMARISSAIGELKEYIGYYLGAKMDSTKASIRNVGLYAGLGVVGLLVGGAILATAGVLLVMGIAQGLGVLFGYRMWLGNLVTGLLILGLLGVGVWIMMSKVRNSWRNATWKKYEDRKREQRQKYGHDVHERAAEQSAATGQRLPGAGSGEAERLEAEREKR
jgi:hypothetical protein